MKPCSGAAAASGVPARKRSGWNASGSCRRQEGLGRSPQQDLAACILILAGEHRKCGGPVYLSTNSNTDAARKQHLNRITHRALPVRPRLQFMSIIMPQPFCARQAHAPGCDTPHCLEPRHNNRALASRHACRRARLWACRVRPRPATAGSVRRHRHTAHGRSQARAARGRAPACCAAPGPRRPAGGVAVHAACGMRTGCRV